MKKFIIRWNAGYGDTHEIIEAESVRDAADAAYEQWRDEAEASADYEAIPYSKELAIDLCLEDDEDA